MKVMLATPTQQQTVNSIDLAKDIETLFHLDLHSLYTLPSSVQLAIIAKARTMDLARIASLAKNESEVC